MPRLSPAVTVQRRSRSQPPSRSGCPAATLRSISGNLTTGHADIDCRIPSGFDVPAFVARLRDLASGGELKVTRAIPAARASRTDRSYGPCRPRSAPTAASHAPPQGRHLGREHRLRALERAYGRLRVGDGSLDHSDEESVAISEYLRGILSPALTRSPLP
jgi:LysW-gamma-L-lysine carboxypeptidase